MKTVLNNKVLWYTFTRYFTYGIQFISSLMIAKYLGPYYLGVWGFITLIIQYLDKLNFGISNSVNTIASINKQNSKYVGEVIGVGVSLLLLLSLVIILVFVGIHLLGIEIGAKYFFIKYVPYVTVIAILAHFNLLFSNIFRVYGKISIIAFNQSILPVLLLVMVFIYRGEELLFALVLTYVIAVFFSFMLYILTSPISLKPVFNCKLAKKIQKKAFYLFIYNSSFYFIIITTRSFVSQYYSITDFGHFTFAYTLANAVLLLFQAISFLIVPKLYNRFSTSDNKKAYSLLNILRDSYVTISHFSMHLIIMLYPVLLLFFSEYNSTKRVFVLIGLTVVTYTNSFGYQGLIIAKQKEKILSLIAFLALILNVILNLLLASIVKVTYDYIIIATMFTYFVYVYFLTKYGRKVIDMGNSISVTLKEVFPLKWMLPFIASIFITLYFYTIAWLYIIPPLLFVILNRKALINTYYLARQIIRNPKITDI